MDDEQFRDLCDYLDRIEQRLANIETGTFAPRQIKVLPNGQVQEVDGGD